MAIFLITALAVFAAYAWHGLRGVEFVVSDDHPSEKQTAVLAPGRDKAMDPIRVHRNALDQAELPPAAIAFTSVRPDTPS